MKNKNPFQCSEQDALDAYKKSISKPTHTPTPWFTKKGSDEKEHEIFSDKGVFEYPSYVGHAEQAKDAKFIVRAVNSHEALLNACKVALERWGKMPMTAEIGTGVTKKVGDILLEAIAQAEGK